MNKKPALLGLSVLALAAFDYSVSGFIRQETAYKINSDQNPQNPNGDPANGYSVTNLSPLDPRSCALLDALAGGACSAGFIPSTFDKPTLNNESDWNVFATRAEIEVNMNFTNNLSGTVKVRGYYQPGVFDDYGDPNLFGVNNHGNEAI